MKKCKRTRPLIALYLEKGTEQYKKRFNTKVEHLQAKVPGKRKSCVRCCITCDGETDCSTGKRKGRSTGFKCSVCDIALCNYCFKDFHKKEDLDMPVCYKPYKRVKLANVEK